jgi:glycerophosphoryl diester phosphodiesterase
MPDMVPFEQLLLPAVVGHRGAPRRAQENTPAAFAAAAQEGATWVELDARLSADDVVVVHHDPRTSDGRAVRERPAGELAALGVHTLVDVLDGLPYGLGVDVECKNLPGEPDFHDDDEHLARAVTEVLRPRTGSRPLMTSSFNPLTVEALAAGLPDVVAGLLHLETFPLLSALEVAQEIGARVLCPHVASRIERSPVAAAHAAGCAVMVWTVDDAARAVELAAVGVDALCTNDPAGIVDALSGAASGRPAEG